ncbi:MAG: hypothetical protein M9894_30660 [Planctomycetes bacterium]|nr:hypothetical protein [Planctomycetota bacterium]
MLLLIRPGLASIAACLALTACSAHNHYVVAATGTVIGVEVARNPDNPAPHAKLGYNRAELALVPTNRPADANDDENANGTRLNGAEESVDVLMELRYGGIFDVGATSGIYQRLAVGKTAVGQPGAAFMFARDATSTLDPNTALAISKAFALGENRRISDGAIVTFLESVHKGLSELKDDAEAQRLAKELDAYAGTIVPAAYEALSDDAGTPPDPTKLVSRQATPSRSVVGLMSYFRALGSNVARIEAAEKAAAAVQNGKVKIGDTEKSSDELTQLKAGFRMQAERVRASLEAGRPARGAFSYYLKLLQE